MVHGLFDPFSSVLLNIHFISITRNCGFCKIPEFHAKSMNKTEVFKYLSVVRPSFHTLNNKSSLTSLVSRVIYISMHLKIFGIPSSAVSLVLLKILHSFTKVACSRFTCSVLPVTSCRKYTFSFFLNANLSEK